MQKVRFDFRGNKIIYNEELTCNGWSLETGKWVGSDEDFKKRFCKTKQQIVKPKVKVEVIKPKNIKSKQQIKKISPERIVKRQVRESLGGAGSSPVRDTSFCGYVSKRAFSKENNIPEQTLYKIINAMKNQNIEITKDNILLVRQQRLQRQLDNLFYNKI